MSSSRRRSNAPMSRRRRCTRSRGSTRERHRDGRGPLGYPPRAEPAAAAGGLRPVRRRRRAGRGARQGGRRLGAGARPRPRPRSGLERGARALQARAAEHPGAAQPRPLRQPRRRDRVRPLDALDAPPRRRAPGQHAALAGGARRRTRRADEHVPPLQPARHGALLPVRDQLRGRADDAPGPDAGGRVGGAPDACPTTTASRRRGWSSPRSRAGRTCEPTRPSPSRSATTGTS